MALSLIHIYFVRRGYALAIQDVRGRSASEGDFLPCYHEVEDGDDTLNWLAGQEWSNGRVGMIGGSYLGYVQWCAAVSYTHLDVYKRQLWTRCGPLRRRWTSRL